MSVAGATAFGLGLGAIASQSISVESAFTGVAKTTDGLTDEFGNLTTAGAEVRSELIAITDISPISQEDIMAVAELGGQLGITQSALDEFASTIADLGEATNLTNAEDAALTLAQFANMTGMAQEDFRNLGSTLVGLGNNFATTERDIAAYLLRIGSIGNTVGFAEAEIVALGTAAASIGVNAEAGGTAFQTTLSIISDAVRDGNANLEILAETAGMTATEFASTWREDASDAFTYFIEGLGDQGEYAGSVIQDLFGKSSQITRVYMGLAGAGDLVRESFELGNQAWEENIALTNEAQARYQTTESQIQILRNRFRNLVVEIGDSLTPAIRSASASGAR